MSFNLNWILDPSGLTPHGFCLLWQPWLIWIQATSNLLIGCSYLAISTIIIHVLKSRKDFAFRLIFVMFAVFVLLCGMGHWLDTLTLWVPAYRLQTAVNAATAIASLATMSALYFLLPTIMSFPSPAQVAAAHDALRRSNDDLELRVVDRTSKLTEANARLVSAAADQARIEEALRQAHKMEAVGQLTGGVAHDFNNLLTPIIGGLDILVHRDLGNEKEKKLILGALSSAERARAVVQRLLAFSRQQPVKLEEISLFQLVTGMIDLLNGSIGPNIAVTVNVSETLPLVLVDPNQIEMAILNLAVNARDAMPGGGKLAIAAAREHITASHRSNLGPGSFVCLSIRDSGCGMNDRELLKAIEPFYTTKEVGKGTGLGLSMVHGVLAQMNGCLLLSSIVGVGTTAELWLPLSKIVDADPPLTCPPAITHASGTVLLVDDDALVRASVAEMLLELGFNVIEAASADAALRLFDNGLQVDLLITDHLMPGLHGMDLVRCLAERRPDLPTLIITGYSEVDNIAAGMDRLIKPFRIDELAASLSEVVESAKLRSTPARP